MSNAIPYLSQIEMKTPATEELHLVRKKEAVISSNESINNAVALTYAEFEALQNKDPKTLYTITDAQGYTNPVLIVPDYDNIETTNRISSNKGTWTAEHTGYVRITALSSMENGQDHIVVHINNKVVYSQQINRTTKGNIPDILIERFITKGDTLKITVQNYFDSATAYFIPLKFIEALPPTITEYTRRTDVSIDGTSMNFYVSPTGSDDNSGYFSDSPMLNIHTLLEKIAADDRLPIGYDIIINIATGEYTFPADYKLPVFNRRISFFGTNKNNTIINLSGSQYGLYISGNFYTTAVSYIGSVSTVGGYLILLGGPYRAAIQNGNITGLNKDVEYYGVYSDIASLRLYNMTFINLPIAIGVNSGHSEIKYIQHETSGNDVLIVSNNSLIDVDAVRSAHATTLFKYTNGGRIFFPGDSMYSTTEQITGELSIANKPIYRRTFNITGPALNATSSQVLVSSGVDLVVRFEAICMTNGADTIGAIYYSDAGNLQRSVSIYHNTVTQSIYCNITVGSNSLYATRPFAITVWYTKV
ncbi:MAG: hypothetical protein LBD57_04510 [Endomicrobium sp.]|jgi:hypothetical protein|uniref:hypothetical protein n=1 Tax=Candidatus Endomicrobiellum cubanum TaxID=3242325 RepID=UPI00281D4FF0|nr:hypothetical protein [Endomicrobium sp.]